MRRKVTLAALAAIAAGSLVLWLTPAAAGPAQGTEGVTPSVAPAAGDFPGAAGGPDAAPVLIEFCVIQFCSENPGQRCDLTSGTRCDRGNCHYQLVNDPSCTTPGTPPSCAVGPAACKP